MATNMPTGLDTFTDPNVNDTLDNVGGVTNHHGLHAEANDALLAVEKMLVGPAVYNVKGYGAKGDGSTDDTTAISAALTAANSAGGGLVYFPAGTYLTGLQTLYSGVHLRGSGITATVLKLKTGANSSLLRSNNFATLTGTNSTAGIFNFSIQDLTLDGNRGGNTGDATKAALQVYGYGYILHNLRVHDSAGVGIYSEWSTSSTTPGNDAMEAHWTNIKVHDCYADGVDFFGPHDSLITNLSVFNNSQSGLGYSGLVVNNSANYAAAASQWTNVHVWGTAHAWSLICQADQVLMVNGQFEGSSAGCILLKFANQCQFIGVDCFTSPIGIKIGDTAAPALNTRFSGYMKGITTTGLSFVDDSGYGVYDVIMNLNTNAAVSWSGTQGPGNRINILAGASTASPAIADLTYFADDAVVALTAGATVALDASQGNHFTLTPAQAETINASNVQKGQRVSLKVLTSGTTSFTLTFGTNFKTTGTLATGTVTAKTFVLEFVSFDGTTLTEVARTVAM